MCHSLETITHGTKHTKVEFIVLYDFIPQTSRNFRRAETDVTESRNVDVSDETSLCEDLFDDWFLCGFVSPR